MEQVARCLNLSVQAAMGAVQNQRLITAWLGGNAAGETGVGTAVSVEHAAGREHLVELMRFIASHLAMQAVASGSVSE